MTTWSKQKTLTFINAVRRQRELWDKEFDGYKNRAKKSESWTALGSFFKITGDEAYKKFKSLRTYANYEHKKQLFQNCGKKTGKWFAYDAMKFTILTDISENCLDSDKSTHETPTLERPESPEMDEDTTSNLDDLQHSPSTSNSHKTLLQTTKQSLEICDKIHHSKLKYPISGFLEHIANKMSAYDQYTRSNVELKISKILYEADMSMLRSQRNACVFVDTHSGATSPVSAKDAADILSEIKEDPSSPN